MSRRVDTDPKTLALRGVEVVQIRLWRASSRSNRSSDMDINSVACNSEDRNLTHPPITSSFAQYPKDTSFFSNSIDVPIQQLLVHLLHSPLSPEQP
jgi:hypothetical protein